MNASAIILGIATIALSGVVSAFVTYRLNLRKDQNVFMRQKAEELYRAFDRYNHGVGLHFIGFFALLQGLIDYNTHLDEQIKKGEDGESVKKDLTEVEMLTGIYFPNLQTELKSYLEFRDKIHEFLRLHKAAYRRDAITDAKAEWFKPFTKRVLELGEIERSFKNSIVAEAHRYKAS